MKLNAPFNVTLENLPDADPWVNNLLDPLNSSMNNMYIAMQGNLSLGDNMIGQISRVSFNTGSTYVSGGVFTPLIVPWNFGSKISPSVIIVGNTVKPSNLPLQLLPVSVPSWTYNYSSASLNIPYIAGLADSSSYTITLLIL